MIEYNCGHYLVFISRYNETLMSIARESSWTYNLN